MIFPSKSKYSPTIAPIAKQQITIMILRGDNLPFSIHNIRSIAPTIPIKITATPVTRNKVSCIFSFILELKEQPNVPANTIKAILMIVPSPRIFILFGLKNLPVLF